MDKEIEDVLGGPRWELAAEDQSTRINRRFFNIDTLLEFCGLLLYGNPLFQVMLIQIRRDFAEGTMEGWQLPVHKDRRYKWSLVAWRAGQPRSPRFFDLTHDLFGMLIAELRLGSDHVEICQHDIHGSNWES